jgi:hypothetical protein
MCIESMHLIMSKPTICRSGDTPLHCAVRCGHAPIAKLLLGAKANPDIESNSGTALDIAYHLEQLDMTILIEGTHITH